MSSNWSYTDSLCTIQSQGKTMNETSGHDFAETEREKTIKDSFDTDFVSDPSIGLTVALQFIITRTTPQPSLRKIR